MNNRCPKCNKKLGPMYFKPCCPSCGANLMYYEMDKRLEDDAKKAQAEWDSLDRFLNGVKDSTIGSLISIIRLISLFLPVASLLLPLFKLNGVKEFSEPISLIALIKAIISASSGDGIGSFLGNTVLGNKSVLLGMIFIVCVVLLSLLLLIFTLFSYQKSGLKRNTAVSAILLIVSVALTILSASFGAQICIGPYICIITIIVSLVLHFQVDKKIKSRT